MCGTEDPSETDEDRIESNPEQKFRTPEQKTEPGVYDKEMDTLQKLFPQKPKVRIFKIWWKIIKDVLFFTLI